MNSYLLECCVDSVESALAAAEGGADRLELCAGLVIGGISPSIALFEEVREQTGLPVRVLLRPRFGDFLYTAHELAVMIKEAELFRKAGAEGIVIGCLKKDGSLCREQMEELITAAQGIKVTLHRAFDLCINPMEAYMQAKEMGIDAILTSGQEQDCLKGMPLLKELSELQRKTKGPKIMAGAGVTPEIIRQFLTETEITNFHLSAKEVLDSGMEYRKQGVPMGIPGMDEYSIFRTDAKVVAEARRLLV